MGGNINHIGGGGGGLIGLTKRCLGLLNLPILIQILHVIRWKPSKPAYQKRPDRRQETGDRRQETGDRRQETGDRRQEDRRETVYSVLKVKKQFTDRIL